MRREIFKEFDGYDQILEEREVARKYGLDYSPDKDAPEQYIRRLHPKRLELRVSEVIEETPSTKTFRLISRRDALPPFLAGQYITLFLEVGGVRTARPFSISSAPNQTAYYDLTVRRVENGLVSNHLHDRVRAGALLESSGPEGHFYHNPLFHDRTMVCLAGGSGITPFMSMVREMVERGLDREVCLFHGTRTLEEAIFHERLQSYAERIDRIRYFPVVEAPPEGYAGLTGLMTGNLIRDTLGDLIGKTFYLCGPQAMYDFCLPELERLGIPGRKIRKEVYGPPADITRSPNWPGDVQADRKVRVQVQDGPVIEARSGESLVSALERQGVLIPSLCRSGECSLCRVKILSGKVFEPPGIPIRRSDRRYGYTHACVAYPLEDLEVLV